MRSSLLGLLASCLLAPSAWAAVAFDNYADTGTSFTDDTSFDITPVGTARAVIVVVIVNADTDDIDGVTADGTAMTEVTDSPILNTTGETGGTHVFFLGSSVPTGTLTIAVDSNNIASFKIAGAVTLTASNDVEVVDTCTVLSNAQSNPACTLSLGSRTSFVQIGAWTGIGNLSASPKTGWTQRMEFDFGNQNALIHTYDTVSTTDVDAGFTQSSDDVAMHAIAVSETAGAAAARRIWVMN